MRGNQLHKFSAWHEEQTTSISRFNKAPWIPWGLVSPYTNLYPLKIQELYTMNALLRRVIDYRASQITGEGLVVDGENKEFVISRLHKIGLTPHNLTRLAKDLALFDAASLQVVFTRDMQSISSVFPTSVSSVRASVPDEEGDINSYFVSRDWSLVNHRGNVNIKSHKFATPKEIQKFNEINDPQVNLQEEPVQIIFDKIENPVSDYYPIPKAESVYDELVFLGDITQFMRNYVENGMVNSAVYFQPFTPSGPNNDFTDEDMAQIEYIKKEFEENFTGKSNAGSVWLQFYNPSDVREGGIGLPKIEKPVEDSNPDKFLNAVKDAWQSAMTGLGVVSPDLFGVRTASGFSSQSEELITADKLSFNQDGKPLQDLLLNIIQKIINRDEELSSKNFSISFERSLPVDRNPDPSMVSSGIITVDEAREMMGLPPLNSQNQNE